MSRNLNLKDLQQYIAWFEVNRRGRLNAWIMHLRKSLFGLWIKWRVKDSFEQRPEPTDILLIQPSSRSKELARKDYLCAKITAAGIDLSEEVLIKDKTIHSGRFSAPEKGTPLRFYTFAGYAKYLVEQYRPKIVITERYNTVLSFYLKKYLSGTGHLVHIAHAIPTDEKDRFYLNYFDYYFLFGQSSLDKLQNKPVRFGESKACPIGSYLIHESFHLEPSTPNNQVLIMAMGDWPKQNTLIDPLYEVFLLWADKRPDLSFYVKLHPNKNAPFWIDRNNLPSNVKILPKDCNIKQAVSKASVVVNMHTNACIEAAILNRPIVPAIPECFADEFDMARFFVPNCVDVGSLDQAYNKIIQNYAYYVGQAQKFAQYHVANGPQSVPAMVSALKSLLEGQEEMPYEILTHKPPS
ncbi:MAG: hypothetical protein JRE63_05905 [Deltaproteobacteria bacterium]|nr:hypothetical protein [Deltaproteobacteria bacterium]